MWSGMAGDPLDVFISYSRKDEVLKNELARHLKILQREGKINTWQDRDIEAGTEWAAEIKTQLEKAQIILLLVTSNFLASDYCYETEMQQAVQRHNEGTARVIPIILKPCSWRYSGFKALQALPRDGEPVTRWQDREEAFLDIEIGIRKVIDSLHAERLHQEQKAEPDRKELEKQKNLANQKQRQEQAIAEQLKVVEVKTVTVGKTGNILKRQLETVRFFQENLGNGADLDMVSIPAGEFVMGSPENELGRDSDEGPQRTVSIPSFFMGRFPITQAQYQAVIGENPSHFQEDVANRPVESVSWNDAMAFCEKLSKLTRRNYRLPSEAEWEYACRAGTVTPFHFGPTITPDLANYDGDHTYGSGPKGKYRRQTTEVGCFPPNAFGLYDMHGNVWEWCQDVRHENYKGAPNDGSAWIEGGNQEQRQLRGGSWSRTPRLCRLANRNFNHVDHRHNVIGFRVACSSE